jgi:hypothetical protein
MVKRLTKHGNSLALILDRGILKILRIDAKTHLRLTTDGRSLIVTPIDEPGGDDRTEGNQRPSAVDDSLERVNRRHGGALERLAE